MTNPLSCLGAVTFRSNRGFGGIFIAAWLVVLTLRLGAQDVFVGEPTFLKPTPAPTDLPKTKRPLRPDYPDELRKTSEYGYAIVTRYIAADGKSLHLGANATHPYLQRAIEAEFSEWKMTTAKQNGTAVDCLFWVPVIFNPKSATVKGPEATPRLLEVTPIFTHERPLPKGRPQVVRMRMEIDPAGALVSAEAEEPGVNPKALESIKEGIAHWRFAPARHGGVAAAGTLVVPVICQPPLKRDYEKMTPPEVIHRVEPEYPAVMKRYRLRGAVKFAFEVDEQGRVQNPTVMQSDNPAFEEPAMEALLKWKFKPGTRDGQPAKTRLQMEVRFDLNFGEGYDAFSIEGKTDQSKLPPEYRFDTSPKVRGVQIPVYPTDLRRDRVEGKSTVAMLIDPQGRVAQVQVVSATRPEFGLALAAAVEGFRFDPALKDGRPVPHLLRLEQDFDDGVLRDRKAEYMLSLEKKHPERIKGASDLDVPLKPVSRHPPVFPVSVASGITKGEAVVEFLVDEDGRVRLPRVVSASEPAFGYAAVQAISSWWFEPPKSKGKPVVVRAQAPVNFTQK